VSLVPELQIRYIYKILIRRVNLVDTFKNIKRTSIVDTNNGNIEYSYSILGNELSVDYVDTPLARKYIGYDLINSDLYSAKQWMCLAYKVIDEHKKKRPKSKNGQDVFLGCLSDNEGEVLQALFISSVTYYGKCFTKAEGRKIKLEASNIPKEYLDKHEEIINFRNTIAAHSGIGDWDTGKLAKLVLKVDNPNSIIYWSELKTLQFFDDREDEFSYLNLLNQLLVLMPEKLLKFRTALLKNEV
jgi:hypothetical protein